MNGDKPRQPVSRNCCRLSCVSWALVQISCCYNYNAVCVNVACGCEGRRRLLGCVDAGATNATLGVTSDRRWRRRRGSSDRADRTRLPDHTLAGQWLLRHRQVGPLRAPPDQRRRQDCIKATSAARLCREVSAARDIHHQSPQTSKPRPFPPGHSLNLKNSVLAFRSEN